MQNDATLLMPAPNSRNRTALFGINLLCLILVAWLPGKPVVGFDGFTEPFRITDLAAAEPEILSEVLVREGDLVTVNQIVAKLDDSVLTAQLEIAKAKAESSGERDAAAAEVDYRQNRLGRSSFSNGVVTSFAP